MSETRFDQIEATLKRHDERFDAIDARFASVDQRFDAIDQRIGVLHEDLIRRIAGVSERDAVSRREFKTTIANLLETFSRRVDPLETVVRQHSTDIAGLKRRR
jgi:hypothetical protein